MKKLKISTRLNRLTDIQVSEKAAVVTSLMDGNTDFQNPYPSVANIITLNANYVAALVKAENGSRSDTAHKNELRAELKNALKALGSWVELNCQDNESILLSSGFHLRSIGQKGLLAVTPDNVKVSDGIHSGEVVVSFKRPLHSISFIARYTQDMASGNWTSTDPFTKTKQTIGGLLVGKDVWVQVRSVNAYGITEWSLPSLLVTVR